jgi:hypothetical protein
VRMPRRPGGRRLGCVLVAACLLLGVQAARGDTVTGTDAATGAADAVIQWNAVMQATVSQVPDPFLQVRSATITQVAVFEAVNTIVGDYQPYLGSVAAPPGASPEAAAVAAAHRALASLHPDQATRLDAHRVASLAAIADGPAKDAGIAVGEAAALAVLANRADDGSDDDTPYTPGTAPGRYRPTPPDFSPAFRPGLGQVETFAIKSGTQFRVDPPPALRSARYTRDYHEVKKVGELHSRNRPPDRAAVARFHAVNDAVQIYFPAARQVSQAQGRTLAENARIFALLGMAIFDAAVACFDSKYLYNLWRPVTAVHLADHDGNGKTDADADWASFVPTAPFPSYPSGSGAFGGAARRVLERLLGADGHAIMLASPLVPDVVLFYTSWKQLTDDVDDARIYGGVHYRFDQQEAARQGRRVGTYVLRHWLRPVHRQADTPSTSS